MARKLEADKLANALKRFWRIAPLIVEWYGRNGRDFPWRWRSDLYSTIVAEKLLQQTRAEQAARVFTKLMGLWPTPCSLAGAGVDELEGLLKPLGFYRFRARELIAIAGALCNEEVTTEASIEKLPGVGNYIKAAILIHAFGKGIVAVDTNVSRFLARTLWGKNSLTKAEIKELGDSLRIVGMDARKLNYALIDFSALVCKLKSPRCSACVVSHLCQYYRKLNKLSMPQPSPKLSKGGETKPVQKRFRCSSYRGLKKL